MHQGDLICNIENGTSKLIYKYIAIIFLKLPHFSQPQKQYDAIADARIQRQEHRMGHFFRPGPSPVILNLARTRPGPERFRPSLSQSDPLAL